MKRKISTTRVESLKQSGARVVVPPDAPVPKKADPDKALLTRVAESNERLAEVIEKLLADQVPSSSIIKAIEGLAPVKQEAPQITVQASAMALTKKIRIDNFQRTGQGADRKITSADVTVIERETIQ